MTHPDFGRSPITEIWNASSPLAIIMLRNSNQSFGWISIFLHWSIAIGVVLQFAFGIYMLSLDYYDPDYHSLPHYHKSLGVLLGCLIIFRLIWSGINHRPESLQNDRLIRVGARWVQWLMNFLLVLVVTMGYLISTATGDGVWVFDWFEIPAVIPAISNQEDLAGRWHYWLACLVLALAGLHAAGAIKHHFIDKDRTLRRMFVGNNQKQ